MSRKFTPLWKRFLRFAAFSIVALITISALAISWISFQGRRDWARTKADLIARGEKLSLVELTPPPVPDELNFFGDPLWKELADTVETPGKNGVPLSEPRLPEGQRQADALDPVFPPQLLPAFRSLFPQRPDSGKISAAPNTGPGVRAFVDLMNHPPSDPTTALEAVHSAHQELLKTTDPTRERELAQFILDVLSLGHAARTHLETLLDRPEAVPIGGAAPEGLPLNLILKIARTYNYLAVAHLTLGQPIPAIREVTTGFRVGDTLSSSPLLISFLLRETIIGIGASTIDRGISTHCWTDSELATLDSRLAAIDLPAQMPFVLRGERGFFNQQAALVVQGDPRLAGVAQQFTGSPFQARMALLYLRFALPTEQAFYNRFVQQYIDLLSHGKMNRENDPTLQAAGSRFKTLHPIVAAAVPLLLHGILTALSVQDHVFETRIAGALERYRLQFQSYPETLQSLVPAYLPAIPNDAIAGQQFHYRRENAGHFLLWSAGWNGIDENGSHNQTSRDLSSGDWVWNSL